jgi:hypothetical protein
MISIIYNSQIPQRGALIHVSIGKPRSASADVQIERSLVPGEYGLALIDKGSHRLLWSVVRAERTMYAASWSIEFKRSVVKAWSRLSFMPA